MSPSKTKKREPKNPITGVRLDPAIRNALDDVVAEMNKERDLSSGHGEITVAGLLRGWVYKFLLEKKVIGKEGKVIKER